MNLIDGILDLSKVKREEAICRHFLFPGTLFAEPQECQVTTVLGSCVSVCLWDPQAGRGGMNHIMLPFWNGDGQATPKFGNIAMESLLGKVLSIGCDRNRLVAKVFGGANLLVAGRDSYLIGERNISVVFQMLDQYGIKVAAQDVGGRLSRKIIMNTRTGLVLVARGKPVEVLEKEIVS